MQAWPGLDRRERMQEPMTVKSEPLNRPVRPSPAVMPRGCVITGALAVLRVIAVALILMSTFGNYVQFVGGWESYAPIQTTPLIYAALYQGVCCVLQWGFKAMRWWLPYVFALLASAAPSFLTYNPVIGPYLAGQIGMYGAIIIVFLLVLAGDALPEWVLVES